MKCVLIFSIFILTIPLVFSQSKEVKLDSLRDENGKMVITSIIIAKDSTLSKNKVFEAIKLAIFKTFGPVSKVITYESKEEGTIYFKAETNRLVYINTSFIGTKEKSNGGKFSYECKVLCKQGKSKVIFSEITHFGGQYEKRLRFWRFIPFKMDKLCQKTNN